jgi:hypothetical protein
VGIGERLGINGKIAVTIAMIAVTWTLIGRPVPPSEWLGDQPIFVQALAMGALYLLAGWFWAPWLRWVALNLRDTYRSLRRRLRTGMTARPNQATFHID